MSNIAKMLQIWHLWGQELVTNKTVLSMDEINVDGLR